MRFACVVGLVLFVGFVSPQAWANRYANCTNIGTGTRTYTPNIQSFLDYSTRRGLGWTEDQIRRELIAVAEEWTIRGETDLRIVISSGSTNLKGSVIGDGVNVISICDPDNEVCPGGGYTPPICGGLGPYGCSGGYSTEGDIILGDQQSGNCSDWKLLHEVTDNNTAGRSVFRTVLHEMGHNLGFDHYTGAYYSVMAAGATDLNELGKMSLQHGDISELAAAGTRRSLPLRVYRGTDDAAPSWTYDTPSYGTALAGIGLLQNSYVSDYRVLFARVSDGQMAVDTAANDLTVYRHNGTTWGHQLVDTYGATHSQPALTMGAANFVVARQLHWNEIRISRTTGGSSTTWTNATTGYRTMQTPGLGYLASVDRIYLVYSNGTYNSANSRRIIYTSSTDDGATWDDLVFGPSGLVNAGIGFACYNGPSAGEYPCSIVYSDQGESGRVQWRPVKPDPSDSRFLMFGTEQDVGVSNDYSSRTPAVTAGERDGSWGSVIAYDRNGDIPAPDYAVRAVSATGANYNARSFGVDTPYNVWLGSTYPMVSEPAVAHFDGWNEYVLFFLEN